MTTHRLGMEGTTHRGWRSGFRVTALTTLLLSVAHGQSHEGATPPLPFAVGERLDYRVQLGAATVGRGSMWIEGPVDVRGSETILLRSSFEAKVAWIKSFARTDSWLDPVRMAALRFTKSEKQFRAKQLDEAVELFPDVSRWAGLNGECGTTATDAPLDELSFIYYLRTLPLGVDSAYDINRHYDVARNPVKVRALRREVVTTPAGRFNTIVVEMRVRDARHYDREGIIRLFLTDDARHLPVRIESPAPVFGTAAFVLETYTAGAAAPAAR